MPSKRARPSPGDGRLELRMFDVAKFGPKERQLTQFYWLRQGSPAGCAEGRETEDREGSTIPANRSLLALARGDQCFPRNQTAYRAVGIGRGSSNSPMRDAMRFKHLLTPVVWGTAVFPGIQLAWLQMCLGHVMREEWGRAPEQRASGILSQVDIRVELTKTHVKETR